MSNANLYSKTTTSLAKALLGAQLITKVDNKKTASKIVETEAYLFKNDPACRASRGKTKRNEAMFGPAGYSYVYLIYGMYYCFNVVSGKEGAGEAVLIRATEPTEGVDVMERRRGTSILKNLCSGPGKLCIAHGLDKRHNNEKLSSGPVRVKINQQLPKSKIVCTTRIGIKEGAELPLRFYIKDNEFISKK